MGGSGGFEGGLLALSEWLPLGTGFLWLDGLSSSLREVQVGLRGLLVDLYNFD